MKKLMFIAVISAMTGSLALADAVCPTQDLWVSGSTTNYTNQDGSSNGFTCHIAGSTLDFSGFSETFSPNPGGIGPTQLTVTPILTAGDQGFMFTAIWGASNTTGNPANNNSEDSTINFVVTDTQGPDLNGLDLGFNGTIDTTPGTTTGFAHVTEEYCLNGSLVSCPSPGDQTLAVVAPTPLSALTLPFTNVTSIAVSKDIGVASGSNGMASISQVQNSFANSPEPRLISLLTLALLAGLGFSKKFKSVLS